MKTKIRLSQCMIVKNEEENIQRALTWGKSIVCEQIVVDTGSTDRTVEIAEEMGAKVFRFEWIDDFAAAKNFAIEQATGNWIAFLDADEYFQEDDVRKIIPLLVQIEEQRKKLKIPLIVRASLANLDDEGKIASMASHARLFSNDPRLRYHKRIHEHLLVSGDQAPSSIDASNQFIIYHTGYSWKAYEKTHKLERNITLLEKEVEQDSENYELWAYLGDSLMADKQVKRAEEVYNVVVDHIETISLQERVDMVFSNLIKLKYYSRVMNEEEVMDVYRKAVKSNCMSPDIEYWLGRWMLDQEKVQQGISYLELALNRIDQYKKDGVLDMAGDLSYIYGKLFYAHKSLGHIQDAVRYGTLYLRIEPYGEEIIIELIRLFKGGEETKETTDAIFGFLSKLYDLMQAKNKLFIIRVCHKIHYKNLENKISELLTVKEKEFINENKIKFFGDSF